MVLAVDPTVTAALVAAAVTLVGLLLGGLWLDRRAHREDLAAQYRHNQRRDLQTLLGRYHGGLLDYATSWNYRVLNFFENVGEDWLKREGVYRDESHYYFHSSVYRFLALLGLAQRFESEQIFIDARFVDDRELEFVKFVKAFHWVMSDVALFKGLDYDKDTGSDHFTSDRLRAICEAFAELPVAEAQEGGGGEPRPPAARIPSFRQFGQRVLRDESEPELQDVFEFFDGLSPDEADRYRWDRLMCLYLLTTAFVTTFGYEFQRPPQPFLENALAHIRHPQVTAAFVDWLPRLGLDQQDCLLTVWRLAAASGHARPAPPIGSVLARLEIGSREISLLRH
jgi:hypothetical protein